MKKKCIDKILAKGEVTGHSHKLLHSDVYEDEGDKTFTIDSTDTLVHEEHKDIVIPKGKYISGIVQEYDHFLEESKKVID